MRFLLGLIPPWGWLVLAAISAAALFAAGDRFGADRVQGRWDAAELERERLANADRMRRADAAMGASARHEATRARLARDLTETRHALMDALRRPLECPAEVGDVVVPADALERVRRAAGGGAAPDRTSASEPGAAVQRGAADPDR